MSSPVATLREAAGNPGIRYLQVASATWGAAEAAYLVGLGEIALVRDVPRTATVMAVQDRVVAAIEREHFLSAVSSHRESADAAEDVIRSRLGD